MVMITIDDTGQKYRPEDFGFRARLEHSVAHTAQISTTTQSIPGRVGMIPVKQEVGSKPITVVLKRVDNDESLANADTDRFLDVLFDDLYRPKTLKIILDYDKDKFINAQVTGGVESVRQSIISEMPLTFVAYDPRRYSVVHADEITWGNETLTFESNVYTLGHENPAVDFSVVGPQSISVTVIGLALQPTIEIEGTATDLVISSGGKKINVGSFSNTKWRIDTEKYIAYKGSTETMLEMDKFLLRNGTNSIGFGGKDINISVTIRFRDRWK